MKKSGVILALAAGCACAATATAQTRPVARFDIPKAKDLVNKQVVGVQRMSSWKVNGQMQQARPGSDVDEVVYDNTDESAGFFVTTSQPNNHVGDAGLNDPGPGAGTGFTLKALKVTIAVETTAPSAQSYDALIQFYDNLDTTTAPLEPVNTDPLIKDPVTGDPVFIAVGFVDPIDPGFVGVPTDFIDLTTIPGFESGIPFPDDNWFVELFFVETGTTTLAPHGTVGFAPGTGAPLVGFSDDFYMRDADGNGQFSDAEFRFFGGPPNIANFYLALRGEVDAVGCFVDCDDSGALDIQDFTCFQNAFALGDLAHADCDGSGTLDIQDFTCFQNGFALGCP